MAWYNTNTVSVSNNSTTVIGDATQFATFVEPGYAIQIEETIYEVVSVQSQTQLTIGRPYAGATNATAGYGIFPTQGMMHNLWQDTTELIDTFGPLRNDMELLTQQIADTADNQTAAAASAAAALASMNTASAHKDAAVTSATTAGTHKDAAAASATSANNSKNAAQTSATNSANSASDANASKAVAEAAAADALANKNSTNTLKTAAEAAANAAATSKTASETARDASITAKGESESARDASVIAKTASETAQTASEAARDTANSHKNAASTSAAATLTSETNAATHKNDAQTAKNAAETARDASIVAKGASVAAQTASEAARDAAVTAKNAAQAAATDAEFWAGEAQIGVTEAAIEAALGYVPIGPDNPTFTGTVLGVTKAMVGLADVDNTSDAAKPISDATQDSLDTKLDGEAFGEAMNNLYNGPITTFYGYGGRITAVENTYSGINANLNLKAPIASPTFTGTVSGITKAMVGLNLVDNTADASKPISDATQDALDLKLNLSGGQLSGNLELRSSAPYLYLRDTDANSAAIHVNSNMLYVLRGGNDTTAMTQVNSLWPLKVDLTNNDVVAGGNLYARGTALVWDQGNLTNVSQLTNNAGYVTSSGTVASAGNADTVDGKHSYNLIARSATAGDNGAWSRSLVMAGSDASTDVFNCPIELREVNYVGATTDTNYSPGITFHHASQAASAIKMMPNGRLKFAAQGGGYQSIEVGDVYASNWIRPTGGAGVYWDAYGRGITGADNGATYGNITTYGTGANGWTGYAIGNAMIMMTNNVDLCGIHSPNQGRWLVNWDNGGNATFSANITAYSDLRLKEDVRPIDNAKARLKGMAGACIAYERDGQTRLGFGAQTLEPSNPELVFTASDLVGTKSVNYGDAVAVVAVNAQMQADRIEALETENTKLKAQLEDVLKRLQKAGI